MNEREPFTPADLAELDERLLSRAFAVIAMQEVHAGNRHADVIALRHDVDAEHALRTAVKIAEWEAASGYRSTYYILHTSPYWGAPGFREALDRIATCGHEIGIHVNALAEALRTGRDPDAILDEALATLRGFGFPVCGVVGHGDGLCNRDRNEGEGTFANDEQFLECARPKEGEPDREIVRGRFALKLRPRPLADFGLTYEAVRLGRGFVNSDSGGQWLFPFDETVEKFAEVASRGSAAGAAGEWASPRTHGQLHLLVHPDWWQEAFS